MKKNIHLFDEVRKRDGRVVPFDQDRITLAAGKALRAVGMQNEKLAKTITEDALSTLNEKESDNVHFIPDIEQIQDCVENAFIKRGLTRAAKSYVLYRAQRAKMREGRQMVIDTQELVSSYLNREDWRVNENANSPYSYPSLMGHLSGAIIARYTLSQIYSAEIAEAHNNGDFHIHDLSDGVVGYCAGWSLRQFLLDGFKGNDGQVTSKPPKHFLSALGQIVKILCSLQNEWAGAQAISSFDTFLAPFVRHDKLDYHEVLQHMQYFISSINISSRFGQTPFTNITFDWTVPEDLKKTPIIMGGKLSENECYGDFQYEMDIINQAFIEIMSKGDGSGRIFAFPIPTYNITQDFDWNSPNARRLFALTGKYGTPYFQNFINSDLKPGDVRSMCCRLQMDIRELRNKTGGLFGAGEQTGSIGVVTINLPRIGYLAQNKKDFFTRLGNLMTLAKESLEIKRKIVQRHLDSGLMPLTKFYLPSLKNHFSTIGLLGMNEACLNFLGCSITDEDGYEFTLEVLDFMRERIASFQQETGHIYNLEATPAEGTSYRLAKIDQKNYPDIICAGDNHPYYTNSTQLPVGYTDDLFEALDLQDPLQIKYNGGTVFHCFLGEQIADPDQVAKLVHQIASTYRMPYFTITPSFSICPVHGYINGEYHNCPFTEPDKKE